MQEEFETFRDFWPFYVARHRSAANRAIHFAGTTIALVCLAGAPYSSLQWLLLALVVGYGSAWLGHLLVERNWPASLGHPLWSLRGALRMYVRTLSGTLSIDLDMAARLYPPLEGRESAVEPEPPAAGAKPTSAAQDRNKPA
jgi:hypothetical protein